MRDVVEKGADDDSSETGKVALPARTYHLLEQFEEQLHGARWDGSTELTRLAVRAIEA